LAINKGNSTVSGIVIRNGVFLTNGRNGAGIGAGFGSGGFSTVGSLVIAGGDVSAHGGSDSAGIGAGVARDGLSVVHNLTLANGSLLVTGVSGCGSSSTGVVRLLNFAPGFTVSLDCSVFDGCFGGSTIISGTGSLRAITNSPTFIDEAWDRESDFHAMSFYGQYRSPSFVEDWAARPLLHLRAISTHRTDVYTLTFQLTGSSVNYSASAEFDSSEVMGVVITLDYPGLYTIDLQGRSGFSERLCVGAVSVFEVGREEAFFEDVEICRAVPPTSETQAGLIIGVSIAAGLMLIVSATLLVRIWRTPNPIESRISKPDARPGSLDSPLYGSGDGAAAAFV
jgi:hypothetical protein